MSQSYPLQVPAAPTAHLPPPQQTANTASAPRLLLAARYGRLGASSRLRLAQYQPYLEAAGISTTLRPFLSDNYVRALYAPRFRLPAVAAAYLRALTAPAATRAHDILWIEKELLPWAPFALERFAIGRKPYILDFDDVWSLRYEQSPLIHRLLGTKFPRLLQGAALTITANDTLTAWARAEGAKNILQLPTVVDLAHYSPCPEPTGPFTIGWIGTPLTATYLETIAEPLRQLAGEAPLRLLIIGAPDAYIAGVTCIHAAWDESTEAGLIAQCHVGIMPLPDDEWARGKSGYKIIQYMAMARPAVASAIGANRQIINHGVTGHLAETPADWLTSLRTLRDNPSMRASFGAAARSRVAATFSLGVTAPVLIDQIRSILGNTG